MTGKLTQAGAKEAPEDRWRAARVAVTAYFVLYGVVLAVWVTRIPAIKQGLGLSDGLLGLALLALPAGVLLVTLVAGRIVDRVGSARVTCLGGAAMALLLIAPALAGGLWSLAAALFGCPARTPSQGSPDVRARSREIRCASRWARSLLPASPGHM